MDTLTYPQRNEPGLVRAMTLAFAVHAVLLAVMFLGVRWQSHPADSVSVELWDPPPPPPAPVVLEKPRPPPPPPPKVEPKPEPQVKKPDIVEKAPPPKPKAKPEAKAKPVPPKDDEFQKRMAKEQLAVEQRSIDEERRRVDEERRRVDEERRRVDEARRKAESDRIAREQASIARNRALGEYVSAIQRKVRQNWILPQDLQGNPEAVFDVVQLPTGEVIAVKVSKPSGNPAYDDAVERAILKSSPLPLPEPRALFSRQLKLTFRPRD